MLKIANHNGISFSSVGVGTWTIGGPYWTDGIPTGWSGPLDDDDSVRGLITAIENGLTHIDTADVYGHGRAERLVARALSSVTADLTVATKVGFVPTSAQSVYSPENIRFQCEQSLRNLGIETIDLYYLHHCNFGPNDLFLDGAIEAVRDLQRAGKIRAICLSGYSAHDLIRVSRSLKPDFIQSWASFEHPEFIRLDGPLAPFMIENNIRFIAMMPFGQGRLLAKHKAAAAPSFGPGDNRIGNAEFQQESLSAVEPKLRRLQDRFGQEPADLIAPALGFLLSHDVVASVVPGFRTNMHVRDICAAVRKSFTAEDRAFIEQIFPFAEATRHPWQE